MFILGMHPCIYEGKYTKGFIKTVKSFLIFRILAIYPSICGAT